MGYELSLYISLVVLVIIGLKEDGLCIWCEFILLGVYVNFILLFVVFVGIMLLCCSVNVVYSCE